MAKKDEKKSSEKEVYRLWWEYLKRSELYKAYCDLLPRAIKKMKKEDIDHATAMEELFVSEHSLDKNNISLIVDLGYMERDWEYFGDIFNDSFDDWWENRKKVDYSLPVVVLNDPDACKDLPRFTEIFHYNKKAKDKFSSPEKILEFLTESETNYIFLAVPMVGAVTMEDISKQIADIRKRWRDKFDVEDFYYRWFTMPVSRIRYDEMKRYLRVYDLKEQGLKMKEIIAEIDPNRRGEDADVLRSFRNDLKKAKKIIRSVECGSFPEEPQF